MVMRHFSMTLFAMWIVTGSAQVQDLQMTSVIAKMDQGKQPAIEVVTPASDRNYTKRQWKRHPRSYDNNNLNKKQKKGIGRKYCAAFYPCVSFEQFRLS